MYCITTVRHYKNTPLYAHFEEVIIEVTRVYYQERLHAADMSKYVMIEYFEQSLIKKLETSSTRIETHMLTRSSTALIYVAVRGMQLIASEIQLPQTSLKWCFIAKQAVHCKLG